MWLVEAGNLRLLFDPLLEPLHHGGVFEVVPRRTVRAEALRPDFVFVSHRHPDHFDLASLHRLARLDPDAVIVTPDPLITRVSRRLGFRNVHEVAAQQLIELDGLRVVTTPSVAPNEWGAMVATRDGVVWNQIDTVLSGPEHVQRIVQRSLAALGQSRVDLALARWLPQLEIAAQLGDRVMFPYDEYAHLLHEIMAIDAKAVVPASAGESHVAPWGTWLDRITYPIDESRFLSDLASLAPHVRGFPSGSGRRFALREGGLTVDPNGGRDLVDLAHDEPHGHDPRGYRPLAIPPIVDPNLADHDPSTMRRDVGRWVEDELRVALARAYLSMAVDRPLRFVIEVVFLDATDIYTLTIGHDLAVCERRDDRDWDALNAVAGSLLWEVLQGRRHWGDVLLAGCLRAFTRAYTLTPQGLRRGRVGATFLYYALSYEASIERAVAWQLDALS